MTRSRKYWAVIALVLVFAAGMAMREFAPTPVQAFGPSVSGTVTVDNFPCHAERQWHGRRRQLPPLHRT